MKKSSSGEFARGLALAQFDARAERDQRRREIADRRAVGDVAADRAARAHLRRAEARHHQAEIGVQRVQMRRRVEQRRAGAEPQPGSRPISIASSPATRPSQMIFFRSRNCLVIQSPTSVAPASSTASGWRA